MSVLAGDWLYMQSFEMALRERNFAILDILIDLTQNMVEGELLQLTRLGRIDLTEAEATELAFRKTACLFSGCARLGAVLGEQPQMWKNLWRNTAAMPASRFSSWTIFWTSLLRPNKLGKPVFSDLKEGKVTLPLIFALQADARKRADGTKRPSHAKAGGWWRRFWRSGIS